MLRPVGKKGSQRIAEVFNLLERSSKLKLISASLAQLISSLFDLLGIACLGLLGNYYSNDRTSNFRDLPLLNSLSFIEEFSDDSLALGLIALTVVSFSVKNVVYLLSNYFMLNVLRDELIRLSNLAAKKVLDLPYSQFRRNDPQHLSYSLNDGLTAMLTGVLYPSINLLAEFAFILFVFIALCAVNLPIALMAAIYFGLIAFLVSSRLLKSISKLSRFSLDSNLEYRTKLISTLSVVREIRTLGKSKEFLEDLNLFKVSVVNSNSKVLYLGLLPKTILDTGFLFGALIIFISLNFSTGKTSETAILLIYIGAAARLIPSLMRIQSLVFSRRYSTPAAERGYNLLVLSRSDSELQKSFSDESDIDSLPLISLRNVSYSYPDDPEKIILSSIDLDIFEGDRISIVGKSGSGKSTLVDLILGIILPTSGLIHLRGQDVSSWVKENPGVIAYQPQEVTLVKGTIRENICLGERAISENSLRNALLISGFLEVLQKFPLGLDTEVSDFLSRMSGGEKQRLVLARTLYSNPKIIILDEATSNLDSAIEREIFDSLKNIGADITIIQISHRINTIPDTEKVIYLKEGHISAAGAFFDIYETSEDFKKFADAASQELT